MKRVAILLGLLMAGIGGFGQLSTSDPYELSTSHPKSKGIVSDYAGKLTEAQVNELANLLKNYEQKTSIEFVVVVVNIQGHSADAYARRLGNAWAVGKAGRDNGIVLLWAPDDRAYALRFAEGLKADMSDADAARITRESLVPNLKRGRYYAALKETVQATMAKLGDETWEERLQARTQAAERARQAEVQGLLFTGLAVLAAAILGLTLLVYYRGQKRRKKLAELAQANGAILENLAKAEANAPQIQKRLDDFGKEAPEQDLTALRSQAAAQAERIAQLKLDATLLNFTDLNSYEEMLQIQSAAQDEVHLIDEIQEKIANIRQAKKQSQALMDQLSSEKFTVSDVRDSSRRNEIDQLLLRSRQDYELARQTSAMSVVDWLLINEILNRSRSRVQDAVVYSQAEPYVPSFRSGISEGRSLLDSSDSSSSSGGGLFSSDSGGGSFDGGGGGGFDGGSGSSGSY